MFPIGVVLGTNVITGKAVIKSEITGAGIAALAWFPGAVTVIRPLELIGRFMIKNVPLALVVAVAVTLVAESV
jgi:hypothetical protein